VVDETANEHMALAPFCIGANSRCHRMKPIMLFLTAVLALAATSLHGQTANKVWRLAVLSPIDFESIRRNILDELGRHALVEGRDFIVDWRTGTTEQLPDLAQSIVATKPDAIIAVSDWAVQSAREATTTIPIVMSPVGQDPVAAGFVASWTRPGGNITGVTLLVPELDEKRVGLLHETVPAARRMAVLTTHNTPNDEIRSAAAKARLELIELSVSRPNDYQASFEAMRSAGAQALVIVGTPELIRDSEELSSMALRAGLPSICASRVAAERGCLIGYGPNLPKLYKRVGDYVVRIFRGADPGELPIEGPTHIELILNLKTARALGITIPEMLISRADEVLD
jgi:putative ABC transport system substrate-binding protein